MNERGNVDLGASGFVDLWHAQQDADERIAAVIKHFVRKSFRQLITINGPMGFDSSYACSVDVCGLIKRCEAPLECSGGKSEREQQTQTRRISQWSSNFTWKHFEINQLACSTFFSILPSLSCLSCVWNHNLPVCLHPEVREKVPGVLFLTAV